DHALIISAQHLTSSAQFTDATMTEMAGLLDKFAANAKTAGKAQLFFEHGVPFEGTGFGGCGICHCHIHSITVDQDYDPIAGLGEFLQKKNCRYTKHELDSWAKIKDFAEHSYLFIQPGGKTPTVFVFEFGQHVESQVMRQFLAQNYPKSNQDWDWRRTGADSVITTSSESKALSDDERRVAGAQRLTESTD